MTTIIIGPYMNTSTKVHVAFFREKRALGPTTGCTWYLEFQYSRTYVPGGV